MKTSKLIIFAAAGTFVLVSCGTKGKPTNVESEPLPKIKSFNFSSDLPNADDAKGLYTISYNADGRIVKSNNGNTVTTYEYSDNKGFSTKIKLPEKTVNQTDEIFFNNSNIVFRELIDIKQYGIKGETNYSFDSKGRLVKQEYKAGEGETSYILIANISYDEATGLPTKIEVDTDVANDKYKQEYILEFSDKPNPVAFYPETLEFFSSNEVLAFTGFTGYSRNRLLSKVTAKDNQTDTVHVMTYQHDFDKNGKLTAIHGKWHSLDENGNLTDSENYIDYTDIKY